MPYWMSRKMPTLWTSVRINYRVQASATLVQQASKQQPLRRAAAEDTYALRALLLLLAALLRHGWWFCWRKLVAGGQRVSHWGTDGLGTEEEGIDAASTRTRSPAAVFDAKRRLRGAYSR